MAGLAITLGGGGARGDFEVGALHFLYEHGLRPDILCTTSVGSVNGLKLAEDEGADPHPISLGPQHLDVFWRGADGALWHKWYDGQWHDHGSLGAAPLGSEPRAVAAGGGQIEVVWRGTDRAPWHKRFDGGWKPHQSLESRPLGSDLHAVSTGGGALAAFWRGDDGALWYQRYDGANWHRPESLGAGPLGSEPQAVSWGPSRIDVLWRGTDGALWHKWFDGQWHPHESLGAGPLGSDPQVASWGQDRLDVFWRGKDGALWHKWYDGQWHDHESLGAKPLGSDPHPVTWGQNRLDVFWRGTDDALWHKWYDGQWHAHESLGAGPLGSPPYPVSFGPQHLDVFWRGRDAALWHRWYDGAWHGPESLGSGPLRSDPEPVVSGPQHVDVFWRGTQGALWHKRFDSRWHAHESLSAGLLLTKPEAVSSGQQRVDVFWRAVDRGPWHKRFDGSGWHADEALEERPLGSEIDVVSSGGGRVDLFWRGDDRALWHKRFDGTVWHEHESLGAGPLGSAPHGISTGHGGLDVFWRGTDGALWHKRFDGAAWHAHESLGAGPLGSEPQVVSWGRPRIDVFWRGTDGGLWHKWYDGQWHAHESLGGAPLGSDPNVVSWGPNRLDVFWRGTEGALWHKWYDGSWHTSQSIAKGPIGSDPQPVARGANRLDVFWRGAGSGASLWHKRYDGGWRAAESLGAGPIPEHGLRGLVETWLSLDTYSDFFAEEAWLGHDSPFMNWLRRLLIDFLASNSDEVERRFETTDTLIALRQAELKAIAARQRLLVPDAAVAAAWLELYKWFPGPADQLASAVSTLQFLALAALDKDTLAQAVDAPSMFNLGPVAARVTGLVDPARVAGWGGTGRKLRMATVSLDSGELRYTTEDGSFVGRTFAPVTREQLAPVCEDLDREVDDLELDLKLAKGEVQRGDARQELVDELERKLEKARKDLADCKARNQSVQMPVTVDLIAGMLASATMPAFFPPVRLERESYVDGGVRAMIPVEAAVRLGADTVIAVSASKSSVDLWRGDKTMSSVALRSLMDIAISEIAFRDAHAPLGFGNAAVTVVEPRVDTHTTFTIYPAFVRNRMAYGYMCAADAIAPPADPEDAARARAIADRIHVLRYLAARLECWQANQPLPPTMVVLPPGDPVAIGAELAAIKQEIKSLVAERSKLGARLPSGKGEWDDPDLWWNRREIHPWARMQPPQPVGTAVVPDVRELNVGPAEAAVKTVALVPVRAGPGKDADPAWVARQKPDPDEEVLLNSNVTLTLEPGLPP